MTHSTHSLAPDGTCDDGSRRYRCVSCQVCATWPEARARCGAIADEQGPRKPQKPRGPMPGSVVVGVPPNRVCAVANCARPYHSKHAGSRYCSQRCAKLAWDVQHNKSQRKLEARQREASRAARQSTRSASEGSRTCAGPSEADNAAQGREEAAE